MSSQPKTPAAEQVNKLLPRVYVVDPFRDTRWNELVLRHERGTLFHSPAWLMALYKTYGYKPFVLTTCDDRSQLGNGIVCCSVRSWLTGPRIVSLPFSDHCEPLVDDQDALVPLVSYLKAHVDRGRWHYFESRPRQSMQASIASGVSLKRIERYCIHQLDLSPSLDCLYSKFHKSCVQRKITKAEREGLDYEEGRSEELVSKFYTLLLTTRRRHQLPPQPRSWFHNLAECFGDSLKFRVISKAKRPIASIVTCQFKDSVVYKYGCSDASYHNLGGTFLLMWRAIQEAKSSGASYFDLGRSELDNEGLITFKAHWGATQALLPYYRYPATDMNTHSAWKLQLIGKLCSRLPDPFLECLGGLLYRHVG